VVSQAEKDRVTKYYHEHRDKVLAKMREKDRGKTTAIHDGLDAGVEDPESLFHDAGAVRRKRPYTRT
jgi:hypothetical protein